MQRQMNGAVVGSMRFYGEEYGLNYGVTLPTIRDIAKRECERSEGVNHPLAKLLYRQEVRELRLAALWLAESSLVDGELEFWKKGIINSDVAEEAAFALLHRCEGVDRWLDEESELLQYCALMSIARRECFTLSSYADRIVELLSTDVHILQNGVVALLSAAIKRGVTTEEIESFVATLPQGGASDYVRSEIGWRLTYR